MTPAPTSNVLQLGLVLISALWVWPQPASANSETNSPKIDPRAEKVLREMSDYLANLKSFRAELVSSFREEQSDLMKTEMTSHFDLRFQRPNKLGFVRKRGMWGIIVVCDGSKFYHYEPELKKYTVEDAGESFDDIFYEGTLPGVFRGSGNLPMVDCLLLTRMYDCLMDGVAQANYVGVEKLDGVKVHRIKCFQQQLDWEVWVETGTRPLVRKVSADALKSRRPQSVNQDTDWADYTKMETTVLFNHWRVNEDLPALLFQFTPPQGAKLVDQLYSDSPAREPNPVLGKEAPSLALDLLDGGKFDLSAHKGKEIVILDFWATWCGPCVRGLPVLIEIAQMYKSKGVVLYAVNLREKPDHLREFMKKKAWTAAVPLDQEGKLATSYHVQGVPNTFVIGKDGLVQAVHIGFGWGTKKRLSAELDALLAGKNLVAQKSLAPDK